jgi:uncharacterized protein (TIGR00730 family)
MQMGTNEQDETPVLPATRPHLIVVGNLTIDDVVLPDGTTQMSSVGGNCLYTALGAHLWQPSIGLVTRRGEDFPPDLTTMLHSLGVATGGVVDIPGPTVRNWVVYETSGERHWIYRTPRERSREVAVQAVDLPVEWLAIEPLVVHIAAMPLDAAESIVDAVRRVSSRAIITLDTHEDYVADYRQRLQALAARVHAFLPSRSELADLVGYDDPLRALAALVSLPTPVIVIKMGAEGALVWDKAQGALHEVGVAQGPVVDVTGAGDAFCGGFAAALSLGCSPLESAQRGAISASYAVAGFGSLQLVRVDPIEAQARLLTGPPVVHRLSAPTLLSQAEVPGADRDITSSVDIRRAEIAVLGSARLTENDDWWAHAHQLGMLLAGEGFVIVTGGYGGLMAAVSRGAHEMGGRVVGLPMQHWTAIEPNPWNVDLRWSGNYGSRINHMLRCDAVIALPGGVGTLSEMAMVWAASQTEKRALPLVLLGACWPPVIESVREHLVVSAIDLNLLRFAVTPGEAVQQVRLGLQDKKWLGQGPHG